MTDESRLIRRVQNSLYGKEARNISTTENDSMGGKGAVILAKKPRPLQRMHVFENLPLKVVCCIDATDSGPNNQAVEMLHCHLGLFALRSAGDCRV